MLKLNTVTSTKVQTANINIPENAKFYNFKVLLSCIALLFFAYMPMYMAYFSSSSAFSALIPTASLNVSCYCCLTSLYQLLKPLPLESLLMLLAVESVCL